MIGKNFQPQIFEISSENELNPNLSELITQKLLRFYPDRNGKSSGPIRINEKMSNIENA